jgi:hypothetical protein
MQFDFLIAHPGDQAPRISSAALEALADQYADGMAADTEGELASTAYFATDEELREARRKSFYAFMATRYAIEPPVSPAEAQGAAFP